MKAGVALAAANRTITRSMKKDVDESTITSSSKSSKGKMSFAARTTLLNKEERSKDEAGKARTAAGRDEPAAS